VLALAPSAASANRQRAYVHNNRNNPIKKNPTDSGPLFFSPEKLGQCFFSASLLLSFVAAAHCLRQYAKHKAARQ
jgi:hypothetical protein